MKKSLSWTFLFWILAVDLASAGEYKIVGGWAWEVCQAYLKNLNSFPDEPPMVCERKVNPRFADFQKLTWQALDARQNFELVREIDRLMHHVAKEDYGRFSEKYMPLLKQSVESSGIRLSVTELDVTQDGTPEKVVQYENGECDPLNESHFANPFGRTYLVLTPDSTGIDEQKSKWFAVGGRLGIFVFKSQVFIDHWNGDLGFKEGRLRALTPLALIGPNTKVCEYSHSEQRRRSKP